MLAMFDDVQNGEGKFRGGGISTFLHSKCPLLSAIRIKKLSLPKIAMFSLTGGFKDLNIVKHRLHV